MADVAKRLAELLPDKRQRLAKLLKNRNGAGTAAQGTSSTAAALAVAGSPSTTGAPLLVDLSLPAEPSARKESWKHFYDAVTQQLNSTLFGQFSYFLNYGYVPDGSAEMSVVILPEHYINKNSVKLVLEVIADCPVEGDRVLDVGCGRGGTVHVLKTFFHPANITGLDLSPAAIDFCRQTHKDPRVSFYQGDAEQLPFEDGSFDIVTNLESSHSYPNIHRFYAEVYRVLVPGGHFLYTDAFPAQQLTTGLGYLQHIGLDVKSDRDITSNVLRSCDEIAATRVQAFGSGNDQQLMQNFLATPGSQIYENMRSGRWSYRILKLRKRV